MLSFIGSKDGLMFEVLMDMINYRRDNAAYFIQKEGAEYKDIKDKLLMVAFVKMMSTAAKNKPSDPEPLSLKDSYNITDEEVDYLWKRREELRARKQLKDRIRKKKDDGEII